MKHETINDLLCLAYWLGFLASYYLARFAIRRYTTLKWTWGNILLTAAVSTCSLFSIFVILIVIGLEEGHAYLKAHKFPDPPTWL